MHFDVVQCGYRFTNRSTFIKKIGGVLGSGSELSCGNNEKIYMRFQRNEKKIFRPPLKIYLRNNIPFNIQMQAIVYVFRHITSWFMLHAFVNMARLADASIMWSRSWLKRNTYKV